MSSNLKERIYKFDNIKFVAILLVVIGHAIEIVARDRGESDMFLSLYTFIYTFHMPLFIFISGLFTKKFNKSDNPPINNFIFYIIIGFMLKFYRVIVNKFCAPDLVFISHKGSWEFMGSSSIEWFMFVLAASSMLVYFIRNVKPYISIPLSIIAGCLIGLMDRNLDYLYIGRLLVYFPFFLAGYLITPKKLMEFTSKLYIRIPSIICLIVYFILCFRVGFSNYISLFTGRNSFAALEYLIPGCSIHHRLGAYVVSSIMVIGMISLIPNVKVPVISHMGKNTLGVYFWHIPIIRLAFHFRFYSFMRSLGDPVQSILILTFGVALTLILSLDIFSWPFKKIREYCSKLNTKTSYIVCNAIIIFSLVFYFIIFTD